MQRDRIRLRDMTSTARRVLGALLIVRPRHGHQKQRNSRKKSELEMPTPAMASAILLGCCVTIVGPSEVRLESAVPKFDGPTNTRAFVGAGPQRADCPACTFESLLLRKCSGEQAVEHTSIADSEEE